MFRFLQASVLMMVIALVVANESEAKTNSAPVHGAGSSHDPRSPRYPTTTHSHEYHNWVYRHWNSFYGCEVCWSPVYGCEFYYYAPAACYYPVSYIALFPPVPVGVAPIIPIVPLAPVGPQATMPPVPSPR